MQGTFTKIVSRLLIVCTLAMPFSSQAGMVSTEQVAAAAQQQDARGLVQSQLARTDVQAQLQAMGISPEMARDRVAAMTDEETARLAGQMQSLPAGAASAWGAAILLGLIIWGVYYFYYR